MSDTTTITFSRLAELLKAELELQALHDGGVDNWDWYDDSMPDEADLDAIDEAAKAGTLTVDGPPDVSENTDDDDSVDDSERTDEDDSVYNNDGLDY